MVGALKQPMPSPIANAASTGQTSAVPASIRVKASALSPARIAPAAARGGPPGPPRGGPGGGGGEARGGAPRRARPPPPRAGGGEPVRQPSGQRHGDRPAQARGSHQQPGGEHAVPVRLLVVQRQ